MGAADCKVVGDSLVIKKRVLDCSLFLFHQERYTQNMKPESKILALGAESFGRFCCWSEGSFDISEEYGDLIKEKNYQRFAKDIKSLLAREKNGIKRIVIDIHPLYNPSCLGRELSRRHGILLAQVQHHVAHVHSVAQEHGLKNFIGIAMDGTGYGLDSSIWGAEVIKMSNGRVERVGSIEQQCLIGGDLAVREPARVLISILSKFLDKEKIYPHIDQFYNPNQFELLFNQMQQNFNCQLASSAGRVLDAASCLLFGINKRDFKHEAAFLLDKRATNPYKGPRPIINTGERLNRLQITPLFEYLIKNIHHRPKDRLAATVQQYLVRGLLQIAQQESENLPIVAAGGISDMRVIKIFLRKKGVLLAQKNPPGDGGLAAGQIWAYLNSAYARN